MLFCLCSREYIPRRPRYLIGVALIQRFRDAPVFHLGIFREKATLQPVECALVCLPISDYCVNLWSVDYSKLPTQPPVDTVYLLDPLIATGGTACAAMNMILDWGVPGTFPSSISCVNIAKGIFQCRMSSYYVASDLKTG